MPTSFKEAYQDIEVVISKKKFPVLDSQIFTPVPCEQRNIVLIVMNMFYFGKVSSIY